MWVLRRAEEYDFERFKKEELSMPRVKANNITMNYDQQGSGEPLILIPTLPPITPAMHSRWQSTPSISPASRWIFAGLARRRQRRAHTAQNFSRMMWWRSCAQWESPKHMFPGFRLAQPQECGWRRNILIE